MLYGFFRFGFAMSSPIRLATAMAARMINTIDVLSTVSLLSNSVQYTIQRKEQRGSSFLFSTIFPKYYIIDKIYLQEEKRQNAVLFAASVSCSESITQTLIRSAASARRARIVERNQ